MTFETLLIPGSSNIDRLLERIDVAIGHANEHTVFIGSGYKSPGFPEQYETEAAAIKHHLIQDYSVSPEQIYCDHEARNTIDNVFNLSLWDLEGEVGVVSNPNHLYRIQQVYQAAQKQGFLHGVTLVNLETKQRQTDIVYERLARAKLWWDLRTPLDQRTSKEQWYKKPLDFLTNKFTQ